MAHNEKKKSVVGFCASLGDNHTELFSTISTQESGTEIATPGSLIKALDEALKVYKKQRGAYPEHVIVYRDGVGKSRLLNVFNDEYTSMNTVVLEKMEEDEADIPLSI